MKGMTAATWITDRPGTFVLTTTQASAVPTAVATTDVPPAMISVLISAWKFRRLV